MDATAETFSRLLLAVLNRSEPGALYALRAYCDDHTLGRIGQTAAAYHQGFPDGRVASDGVRLSETGIEFKFVASGTHNGAFFGLSPTGRQVALHGTCQFRVSAAKIVEFRLIFNPDEALEQMDVFLAGPGIIKPPCLAVAKKAMETWESAARGGGVDLLREFCSPDLVLTVNAPARFLAHPSFHKVGGGSAVERLRSLFDGIRSIVSDDLAIQLEEIVGQGSTALFRLKVSGTRQQKAREGTILCLFRVHDEKVAEHRVKIVMEESRAG
jgi:hypothetical protein